MMKIFVSWSGKSSRQVAELLRDWVPNVIQQAEMFVSSQDIAKGARGLEIIGQNLETTNFGLLVLTPDNATSPWINFEAGALSKSLAYGHVIPLLCGIAEVNIPNSPLRQFQHAKIEKDEMRRVVQDINHGCERPLSDEKVALAFEKWWPELIEGYGRISLKPPKPSKEKDPAAVSETILEALGSLMSDVNSLRRELSRVRNSMTQVDRSAISNATLTSNALSEALRRYAKEVPGTISGNALSPSTDAKSFSDILGSALADQNSDGDKN